MRYLNLHEITGALTKLLALNIKRLQGSEVVVNNLPPERPGSENDAVCLNLYLYHVSHDADGGNELPLGVPGRYPIATRPMPLKLFYVMTAHGPRDDDTDLIADQQKLMGLALKSFHDFPVIDAMLSIDGTPVLDTLEDRTIEIILRPVAPEESVSFWSIDQVRSARLAAFYEVRTALLPPEPVASASGVVADLALRVDPGGRAHLIAASADQVFTLPAALGGTSVTSNRSPASVALKTGSVTPDMRMAVAGTGLGDGSDLAIVLRGGGLGSAAILVPADNANWAITLTRDGLALAVRPSAQAKGDVGLQPVAILPGTYTIAARRSLKLKTEGNLVRTVEAESNRVSFAVAPHIVSAVLDGSKHVIVKVSPAYKVADPHAEPQLSIGADMYRRVGSFTGTLAKDRGTFIVTNPDTYEAVPLFDPALSGRTYQLRLGVNGVDAQPFWMLVP
jgi:hypothetical protein